MNQTTLSGTPLTLHKQHSVFKELINALASRQLNVSNVPIVIYLSVCTNTLCEEFENNTGCFFTCA